MLQMEMNSNPVSGTSPKKSSIHDDETTFKQSLGSVYFNINNQEFRFSLRFSLLFNK